VIISRILKVFLILALITIMIPNTFWEVNWVEVATFAILIGIGIWTYGRYRWGSKVSSSRMWQLGFDKMDNPENWNWPPAPAIERGEESEIDIELRQQGRTFGALIPVRVKARHGVSVSDIDMRFVGKEGCFGVWPPWRDIRLWKWNPLCPIHIEKVRDAFAERFLDSASDDYPEPRDNYVGGIALSYSNPKRLLAGDSLWLILEITGTQLWTGYLEFMGPTPDGNRGYCRRKITVRPIKIPNPDKVDSQKQ
jgi:hypothetical protein